MFSSFPIPSPGAMQPKSWAVHPRVESPREVSGVYFYRCPGRNALDVVTEPMLGAHFQLAKVDPNGDAGNIGSVITL